MHTAAAVGGWGWEVARGDSRFDGAFDGTVDGEVGNSRAASAWVNIMVGLWSLEVGFNESFVLYLKKRKKNGRFCYLIIYEV